MRGLSNAISHALAWSKGMAFVGVAFFGGFAAMGEDGSSVSRVTLSQFVDMTLSGDKNATKCNALWETDLNNNDGNLWYQSAIKVGDVIYCSAPAISGSAFNIRCFDAATGKELSSEVIDAPDYMMTKGTHRTILSTDGVGTLLAMRCMTPDVSGLEAEGIIRITALERNGSSVFFGDSYIDIATEIDMITENEAETAHMERVAYFNGNFPDGNFSFGAMIGWNDLAEGCYKQSFFEAVSAGGVISSLKRADMEALDNPDKVNRYVDFLLLDDGSAVATANDGWPLLCTGASWATIAERMDEAVPSFTSDDAQSCRGFDTFYHNGHRMAVFAAHHNEADGVKFNIAEWPQSGGSSSFSSLVSCWAAPSEPFPYMTFYPKNYRHILLAERASEASRSADDAKTRFYLYAPGCGLAAYELHTPYITGISTVAEFPQQSAIAVDGKWLRFGKCRQSADIKAHGLYVMLYDMAGRMIFASAADSGSVYVGHIRPGVYMATVGSETAKVVLK